MSLQYPVGTSYRAYRLARNKRRVPRACGPCHLCGREESRDRPIVADHCHACDIIRGVLCVGCNNKLLFADEAGGNFPLCTEEWLAREMPCARNMAGHP
jgi:hypothetical protein